MKALDQFIGLYPLSKTLRFKLVPIGQTAENLANSNILDSDKQKAEYYPKVKKIIDECHKYLINESLCAENIDIDWNPLKDAIEEYQRDKSDKNKNNLEVKQKEMRSAIFKKLQNNKYYKELISPTPKDLLADKEIIKFVFPGSYQDITEINTFEGFATYFTGFQENRKNIYTDEAISTGVPFRSVHDNFPKFLANIELYGNIKEMCPEVICDVEKELQQFLDGVLLDDVFSVDFYNSVLNQSGIDYYNQIIGGVTIDEGQKKLRGINEFVNLYRQQHPELKAKKKALTMTPLFKQILSDRETSSFIPQAISSDEELIEVIKTFHNNITSANIDGSNINVIEKLCALLTSIKQFEPEHIYINNKSISDLSQKVCKSWSHINECLKNRASTIYGTNKKASLKKIDAYLKQEAFSLEELSCVDTDLTSYFCECADKPKNITDKYVMFIDSIATYKLGNLKNDAYRTELIKDLLDAYMDLLHKAECLNVSGELDLDKSFYASFSVYYESLRAIIPLYTKVRNYLTQKPYCEKKYKLNFNAPTLANGWDKNKEKDNKAILLFKEGKSYLAITAPSAKIDWDKLETAAGEDVYTKMIYKLIPGPNKMLPKVFFSKKGVDTFSPSEHILNVHNSGSFKKGNNFEKRHLHEIIDFYKAAISMHPDWKNFGFVFSPTDTYEDISAFYDEISMQGYKLSFVNVSAQKVEELVSDGKIFLFQIYNKDFAEGAHGSKNLHTMYWENIFSEENLKNLVIKLNGQAELFYREESIIKPFVHKVGEKMLNKRDQSGMPIPDKAYKELCLYYNGKLTETELSAEAKSYINNVIVKTVTHEIVKDRRYTKPHFQFHVPMTINFRSKGNVRINEMANEYLKDNPDVNIIGLDRGERHLIYLTLINQKGDILKQKTFNIVNQMNYQAKLTLREKERNNARMSWQSVGKIKELKEGFLSAVIHEITSMMVEYNAIVVMEDLNFGFKRGRFKVERQVYQKFEKMLIDKLNYLPFKNRVINEAGGILRGYQLTDKFDSFQKLGKQSGFLFYIPAAYTSKIDPVSGFVNIFNFNDITNAATRKEFFGKFDAIKFVSEKEGFEFTFNYDNFKTHQTDFKKCWTVSTFGKRIVMTEENGHKHIQDYYPTVEIIKLFKDAGIYLKPNMDIKAVIDVIEPSNTSASFFSSLFFAFKTTLQMRNSNAETDEDFIVSPVKVDGHYFNSDEEANKGHDGQGNWISKLPVDADANGAYHIALKGLFALTHPNEKVDHAKWLEFMQTKPYKK